MVQKRVLSTIPRSVIQRVEIAKEVVLSLVSSLSNSNPKIVPQYPFQNLARAMKSAVCNHATELRPQ